MILRILLSGDGGQGIQLIADLISVSAMNNGFQVTQIPNYGLEQRGGVSLSFIKISDKEIMYPKFTQPDILLIMSEQANVRTKKYQENENLKTSPEFIEGLKINDYLEILKKENIFPQSYNIFFLGVIAKILEEKNICKKEDIFNLLEKKLSTKPGWEENKKAFEIGLINF